jgi:SAM-dependent methyltransferase
MDSQTFRANLYDFPKYYDLLFGSDCQAELRFLSGCFRRHAGRPVRRVFEPACGTGRLLIRLAKAGYEVAGNDLNSKAVEFCNDRLERHGFSRTVSVGDMADFRVRRRFDAAYNMINSFRHLATEAQAEAHLRCVADALHPGGLYVLGLHLTPRKGPYTEEESWSARRGHLAVTSYMWTKHRDLRRRNEKLGLVFHIHTPTRSFRIEDEMDYRTYTAEQFQRLLRTEPRLEAAATYDFHYRLSRPTVVGPRTEDVVFVLRRVRSRGR